MKMIKSFSREELYEEIWEISAKQVSLKYDLSYSDLLKKCKEFEIPIPNGSYWYRKNTGQDLSELIVPLPQNDVNEVNIDRKSLKNNRIKPAKHKEVSSEDKNKDIFKLDTTSIRSSLSFLEDDKIELIIEAVSNLNQSPNKRLHKSVANLRDKIAEWNKREKAASYPYFDSRHRYNDLKEPKFVKSISLNSLPRLYRFLDTLVTVLEKIGDNVTSNWDIQIEKDIVRFEVIESTDKVTHELTKEEAKELAEYNDSIKFNRYAFKPRIKKYDYIPNGKFRFKIIDGKYIKDTKEFTLEREERARQYEEEQDRKRKLQNRIEEEKKRTMSLLNMLEDFQTANDLRLMADKLEIAGKLSKEEIEWIRSKADWIDPIVSSTDELLGIRNHENSREQKEQYLSEKRYYW
ncbi:cellulose synthase [Streptococcus mitis 18/56]|uniref:Cellulose synthase n=1 Tax=Streptococcus mitis 18/56 TaxID=1340485 RepID=S7XP14_STRMT|nr:cellulose synthase [Streptococcus mitis 18/56]